MNIEETSLDERAARFRALGDPMRLAIVDALAVSDLSPKELESKLGAASNLVAHHLGVLQEVGLVGRSRSEGDRRRSYVRLRPAALERALPIASITAARVVFVCTANSARSQLAAAIWAQRSDIPVASAGTHPADSIVAGAVNVAERRGVPLLASTPMALDEVVVGSDFVVTVCDFAHEALVRPSLHWSIPDPVPEGSDAAFDRAFDAIAARIDELAPRVLRAS